MDDTNNPKVSFIPKGSLVREESFLERPRPRSAIGFLAGLVFISSVGLYIGLYFYEISLAKEVGTKTSEIKHAQKLFSDAPQVRTARLFRSRADLARELLSAHTVISPVLAFLSKNTLETVLYDKFSFLKGTSGQTLQLSGEALNYAALAYQADVLRLNTKELSSFLIQNIALTNFGTVTFTLDLVFLPGYLSYERTSSSLGVLAPQSTSQVLAPVTTGILPVRTTIATIAATSSAILTNFPESPSTSTRSIISVPIVGTPEITPAVSQKQPLQQLVPVSFIESVWSKIGSLWSRFKFW